MEGDIGMPELVLMAETNQDMRAASEGDVLALSTRMVSYWTSPMLPGQSYRDWALLQLGCVSTPGQSPMAPATIEEVYTLGKKGQKVIQWIQCILGQKELLPLEGSVRRDMGWAFSSFKCAYELLEREVLGRGLFDQIASRNLPRYVTAFHISFMYDMDLFSDQQHLQLYLLGRLQRAGYRRMGTECFKEICVNGVGTHAWESVMGIEDFVYRNIDKDRDYQMWLVSTRVSNSVPDSIKYLMKCIDDDFPVLVPDRHLFAFRNGVYDADANRFHLTNAVNTLSRDKVAVRFFDVEFNPGLVGTEDHDWEDIATPLFESIFEYQQFEPDTIRLVYAMLGRMLYPVNCHDQWQIVPFWKGVAGCGKSTVAAVISHWFPAKFVSTITNTMEDKFGLAAIVDTYVCLCTEVTSKFPLNRGVWQSMVTGEQIPVPRKYRDPLDQPWTVPLAMFGNELPPFDDKSGSVHRRMAMFAMRVPVGADRSDPTLLGRLKGDVGSMLVKCNRAYRQLAVNHGNRGFWTSVEEGGIATAQMCRWHSELLRDIDVLTAFMCSGKIKFEAEAFISDEDFKAEFKDFVTVEKKLHFDPAQHWVHEHIISVLANHGAVMEHGQRVYDGYVYQKMWFVGLRLRTPEETNAEMQDGGMSLDDDLGINP